MVVRHCQEGLRLGANTLDIVVIVSVMQASLLFVKDDQNRGRRY